VSWSAIAPVSLDSLKSAAVMWDLRSPLRRSARANEAWAGAVRCGSAAGAALLSVRGSRTRALPHPTTATRSPKATATRSRRSFRSKIWATPRPATIAASSHTVIGVRWKASSSLGPVQPKRLCTRSCPRHERRHPVLWSSWFVTSRPCSPRSNLCGPASQRSTKPWPSTTDRPTATVPASCRSESEQARVGSPRATSVATLRAICPVTKVPTWRNYVTFSVVLPSSMRSSWTRLSGIRLLSRPEPS
jgi:hypothetical protein